jgi:hypothetical protein
MFQPVMPTSLSSHIDSNDIGHGGEGRHACANLLEEGSVADLVGLRVGSVAAPPENGKGGSGSELTYMAATMEPEDASKSRRGDVSIDTLDGILDAVDAGLDSVHVGWLAGRRVSVLHPLHGAGSRRGGVSRRRGL